MSVIKKPTNPIYRLQVMQSETVANLLRIECLHISSDLADKYEKIMIVKASGVWARNRVLKNSLIHVIEPEIHNNNELHVTNDQGLLVVNPDNLLTCTLVSSTFFCLRKSWLNQLLGGPPGTAKALIIGTIVHEVFQHAVKHRIDDMDTLIKFADENFLDDATTMLECYSVESSLRDVRDEILDYLKSVVEWVKKYLLMGPMHPLSNNANLEVKVLGVNDIEENVWSTKYGLKGKIDVTGSVRICDSSACNTFDAILPLELKTGNPNPSNSHRAQVSLYSMMIEDRYKKTNRGLLIYLKNKAAMFDITVDHRTRRDLINRRNEINYHLRDFYYGPEMEDDMRMCQKCDRLTECIYLSQIYNPGVIDSYSSMPKLTSEATGHLSSEFTYFYRTYHEKLTNLLNSSPTPEASDELPSQTDFFDGSQPKYFWTFSSREAEAKQIGYGNLVMDLISEADERIIIFRRNLKRKRSQSCDSSFSEDEEQHGGDLNATKFNYEKVNNARVAVSIDSLSVNPSLAYTNSSTAIAVGYIQKVVDDRMIFKVYEGSITALKSLSNKVFRLDRLNKKPRYDIEKSIMNRLLEKENWRVENIRRFLVDRKFKPVMDIEYNLLVLSKSFEYITQVENPYQVFINEAVSTDNYYAMSNKLAATVDWMKLIKISTLLVRVIRDLERNVVIVSQNIDDYVDLMDMLKSSKIIFRILDDGSSVLARSRYPSSLIKVPQDKDLSLLDKYSNYIKQHEIATVIFATYTMSYAGHLFIRKYFDYCLLFDSHTVELLKSLGPMFSCQRWIILSNKMYSTPSQRIDNDVTLLQHLNAMQMV